LVGFYTDEDKKILEKKLPALCLLGSAGLPGGGHGGSFTRVLLPRRLFFTQKDRRGVTLEGLAVMK